MKCPQEYSSLIALSLAGYSAFEFWLGKTKKTKANSLVEFLAMVIGAVIVKLILRKGNDDGKSV
jgi:hypothetical protein